MKMRIVPETATEEMTNAGWLVGRGENRIANERYSLMLIVSPSAGRVSREAVERVARALMRRQIEVNRRWDTPPERLAEIIDSAVDHVWPQRIPDAQIAIAALDLEMEGGDGR